MKKRLREKKHLGEFARWGRQLIATRNTKADADAFQVAFILEAIETNGCRPETVVCRWFSWLSLRAWNKAVGYLNSYVKLLAVVCFALFGLGSALAEPSELRGGWSPTMPYQYESVTPGGLSVVSGVDLEVIKAAARRLGIRPIFEEVSRAANMEAVREGRLDFCLAVEPRASAREWAWFTVPYRSASIAIITRRGEAGEGKHGDAVNNLRNLFAAGATVAVNRSLDPGAEATALLESDAVRGQVLDTQTDVESVALLMAGKVDAVIGDRLSIASAVVEVGAITRVQALPGDLNRPALSIMLSRKAVSPTTFQALDEALREMRDSGELDRISRHYLAPKVLEPALQTLFVCGSRAMRMALIYRASWRSRALWRPRSRCSASGIALALQGLDGRKSLQRKCLD